MLLLHRSIRLYNNASIHFYQRLYRASHISRRNSATPYTQDPNQRNVMDSCRPLTYPVVHHLTTCCPRLSTHMTKACAHNGMLGLYLELKTKLSTHIYELLFLKFIFYPNRTVQMKYSRFCTVGLHLPQMSTLFVY